MGYDFKPRNKKSEWYHLRAFSWPFMLDAGLGLVLGTGEGFRPAEFIYVTRPDRLCVQYNDGAKVSAVEAKELAKVARWIARIQDARLKRWEKMPEAEQLTLKSNPNLYKTPWHRDGIESFLKFAEWAEKSGGFTIH